VIAALFILLLTPVTRAEVGSELHGSYGVALDGPVFHSFRLGFQVRRELRMGLGGGFVEPEKGGPKNWSDPYLYADFNDPFPIPGFLWIGSLTLSLPVTRTSNDSLQITSLGLAQSWIRKTGPTPWEWGIQAWVNPVLYNEPVPENFQSRPSLNLSLGHLLSYRITRILRITTSSRFSYQHRSDPDSSNPWLESASPATFRLGTRLSPSLAALFLSLDAFAENEIGDPRLTKLKLGAQLALGF
jgi:hypothetical protein